MKKCIPTALEFFLPKNSLLGNFDLCGREKLGSLFDSIASTKKETAAFTQKVALIKERLLYKNTKQLTRYESRRQRIREEPLRLRRWCS